MESGSGSKAVVIGEDGCLHRDICAEVGSCSFSSGVSCQKCIYSLLIASKYSWLWTRFAYKLSTSSFKFNLPTSTLSMPQNTQNLDFIIQSQKNIMPREDIEFQTHDHVTLRGWLYKPVSSTSNRLPCLILSHGFSALKEMDLNTFAEYFTSKLPLSCLVYDNRGFGSSDVKEGQPRHEIIPSVQCSDISDAITYAQSRTDVDEDRIGIWGSSYSGGHVLWVGAVDRRVKAVLSQVPCVSGYDNFHRLIRPDFVAGLNKIFQEGK